MTDPRGASANLGSRSGEELEVVPGDIFEPLSFLDIFQN
jgi:hypothetical protein